MNNPVNEIDSTSSATPATRRQRSHSWLPVASLEPGMVLAKPLTQGINGTSTPFLAAGIRITASSIAQIINRGIESIAVLNKNRPHEEASGNYALEHEARLRQIFGDHPNADCQALFDALLADGPNAS